MNYKKKYSEQIKSPKWQKKRLEILNRDNFTCQICGCGDKTLHVHHVIYIPGRSIWEYEDNQLVTLCEDCHVKEHALSDFVGNIITDLKYQGLTNFEIEIYLGSHIDAVGGMQVDSVIKDMSTINPSKSETLMRLAERRKVIAHAKYNLIDDE